MQHPFILLASTDPAVQDVAVDAILETSHGLRSLENFSAVGRELCTGTNDVALAIVDLDFQGRGLSLLHLLAECERHFPVLAIVPSSLSAADRLEIFALAAGCLEKPIRAGELQSLVREICRRQEMNSHPEPPRESLPTPSVAA